MTLIVESETPKFLGEGCEQSFYEYSKLLYLHETELSSEGKCKHTTSSHRNIDELELLLISHPGEFDLVSGDRSGGAQRHDYNGQVGGSGGSGVRDSANFPVRFVIQ